jgi:hypothetical protein
VQVHYVTGLVFNHVTLLILRHVPKLLLHHVTCLVHHHVTSPGCFLLYVPQLLRFCVPGLLPDHSRFWYITSRGCFFIVSRGCFLTVSCSWYITSRCCFFNVSQGCFLIMSQAQGSSYLCVSPGLKYVPGLCSMRSQVRLLSISMAGLFLLSASWLS